MTKVTKLIDGMKMTEFRRAFMAPGGICNDDTFAWIMSVRSLDGVDPDALGNLVTQMKKAGIPAEGIETDQQILEAIIAIGSKAPRAWCERFNT